MRTVSLELSKQLKEAGYPQNDTHFMYINDGLMTRWEVGGLEGKGQGDIASIVASPTADEILDQLPTNASCDKGSRVWVVKYWWGKHPDPLREAQSTTHWHREKDNSLADAAALMWLYLKKEGLL